MLLAVLCLDGRSSAEEILTAYETRLRALAGCDLVSVHEGSFSGLVAPTAVPLRPLIARRCGLVAVGSVRLDNRDEVRNRAGATRQAASDLELVLEAYQTRGPRSIPGILGDFAFAIYDPATRTLVAARDAFGVKPLFIGQRAGFIVLSSHLEPVHDRDDPDEDFIADFLLGGDPGPERTIWADSQAVPQGSMLSVEEGRITTERFWTPYDFEPSTGGNEREQVEGFRELFQEAVRLRVDPGGRTWAHLSGGLDSSSVVSVAQTLARAGAAGHGLAGTISVVDELGDGDERRFSDLVAGGFTVPNHTVMNVWPWSDDGEAPPRTDEPRSHYPFFARDRSIRAVLSRAGASVLLTGWGSDHYLYGSKLFIADAVACGRLLSAVRLVTQWSIAERRSFWGILVAEALLPNAPAVVQRRFSARWDRIPDWIRPQFIRRTALSERLWLSRASQCRRGGRFCKQVADAMQELTRWLPREAPGDHLELRHPFLYRPLVEHGLKLPPSMRARPLGQKWVLRQAMKGILPEAIRSRPGKGGIDARVLWALDRERLRIDQILSAPLLADLGIISAEALRTSVEAARHGAVENLATLLCALGLETWLFVRHGRWTITHDNPTSPARQRAMC